MVVVVVVMHHITVVAVAEVGDAALRPRIRISPDEAEAHAARLAAVQKKAGRCLWLELEPGEAPLA